MPKGRNGCFACGQPTRQTVQVWMRDFIAADGKRQQATVGSVSRSFCGPCAATYFAVLRAIVRRRYQGQFGCGTCGGETICRIQLWLRERPDMRSVCSVSASYCEECSYDTWTQATTILDGDSWRECPPSIFGDLSGARKKQRQRV